MNNLLSSNNLFHFTRKVETIKLILEGGFRFSLLKEHIIDANNPHPIFGISYCDIPFENTSSHRKCYGNYAIVLRKDWGIRNGISPVRYIHHNSPGASQGYLKMKAITNHFKWKQSDSKVEYSIAYLLMLQSFHDSGTQNLDYTRDIDSSEAAKHRSEFVSMNKFLVENNRDYAYQFALYLRLLQYRITELENELSIRNYYVRNYKENFICPIDGEIQDKILYDEREWRAVKAFGYTEATIGETYKEVSEYVSQGFLPANFNLSFSEGDVLAVIVEDNDGAEYLFKEISDQNSFISKTRLRNIIVPMDKYRDG